MVDLDALDGKPVTGSVLRKPWASDFLWKKKSQQTCDSHALK